MRIYISGALAASRDLEGARRKYESISVLLAAAGHEPYLPHKETDPELTPTMPHMDVFKKDLESLLASDLAIAFMDEPSLGVGAEIVLALERGIPLIGVWHRSARVSRFICGLLEVSPGAVTREYEALSEIVEAVSRFVEGSNAPGGRGGALGTSPGSEVHLSIPKGASSSRPRALSRKHLEPVVRAEGQSQTWRIASVETLEK